MKTNVTQLIGLTGWLLVTFIAATIGAAASVQTAEFYAQLKQPSWAPPAQVFGPVWSLLYTLMGFAAWIVWRQVNVSLKNFALILYLIQLVFNALWSWLFFGWQLGGLAFANIVLLWVLIAATLLMFWRQRKLAGILLVPYLLWITFASVLNYAMWQLNPQLLG